MARDVENGTRKSDEPLIYSANFEYHGDLTNLLVRRYREGQLVYHFKEPPGIKDAIEAMGVPHTEVDVILVNDKSVEFSYRLQHNDHVSVYPVHINVPGEHLISLSPKSPSPVKFVLDVHLGSLARRLRLLGFDACYRNDLDDTEIMDISREERRIILTRDFGIIKHKRVRFGYLVRSDRLERQVSEVLSRYNLGTQIATFSRCMACNGTMVPVDKGEVWERLEPKTRLYFDEFHCCSDCMRIYWRGSHFVKIEAWLENFFSTSTA